MKKRIYFLLSASIQIVAYVFAILDAKQIVANFLEVTSALPGEMAEKTIALYQNSGTTIVIMMASIGLFLNFLIIFWAISDKLLEKKVAVITCSIISFILAEYVLIKLFAIINIIVMIILKTDKSKVSPKVKKEIPKLQKETVDKKKIIGAVVLLAIYLSQFIWSDLLPEESFITALAVVSFYVLTLVLTIIVFKDLYKDNFKAYFGNFKAYMRYIWPRIGIFYIIYFVIAMIVFAISGGSISANQNSLEGLPIFILIPLAIIYAPIVEEALFRGCLRRFIKNDIVFIIISGITFGLLHTIGQEATIAKTIILAIPYATLGSFMAYLYAKTNNIFTNMTFHAFQNSLAVIVMLLI